MNYAMISLLIARKEEEIAEVLFKHITRYMGRGFVVTELKFDREAAIPAIESKLGSIGVLLSLGQWG